MKAKKPVILIVEDEVNDQFLLQAAFKSVHIGCSVNAVSDGEEAVRYLQGKGQYADRSTFPFPTVMTIDLKMPKMNGFELLAFLKRHPHLNVISTVVLTSSADENDVTNAFRLGANAYHVKPQSFDAICTLLKTMHDYWSMCEIPQMDSLGKLMPTEGGGKLSEQSMISEEC